MLTRSIPNYELYGEFISNGNVASVHHEKLRERSQKHNWKIRLHRHKGQAQVFLLKSPGAYVQCGELGFRSVGPVALFVPPGVAHGFEFPEDMSGDVLSLSLDRTDPGVTAIVRQLSSGPVPVLSDPSLEAFKAIQQLMGQSRRAFARPDLASDLLLQQLARLILLYFVQARASDGTHVTTTDPAEQTAHETQSQAFCRAVEKHFSNDLKVGDYARLLGVSSPHLSRICRKYLETSPNELIRQRRLVEAKRLLEFTRQPIADIGFRVGFREPGFFCRSFKQSVGMTPKQYRAKRAG